MHCCDVILYVRLTNEFYAHDTSCKIKSVFKAKGMSGKHLTGTVIYGYLWDEKREHWLVDEEAAAVVGTKEYAGEQAHFIIAVGAFALPA